MKLHKTNSTKFISLSVFLILFCAFSNTLPAQQKFTVKLADGTYRQYPAEGLKLTFDNNGAFTIWQNDTRQNMNFTAVEKITFTDQTVDIRKDNFTQSLSAFVDPSGMLHIAGELDFSSEICIFSLQGIVLFKKEQSISVPIDISGYKPGVYILKAGNQIIKFMKQ